MDKEELQKKIRDLLVEKDAILLAHNYQVSEIQEIADYLGDSLGLCIQAQGVEADKIVFCGVDFMAETAAILNPDKMIIHPNPTARCPMAAMLPVGVLKEAKYEYPEAPVVLYINTLAEAKAECDVVCTSRNAANIVEQLEGDRILFGPDKNLAYYVQKRVPDKELIPVPAEGYCNVHHLMGSGEEAMELKEKYPQAELIVHPECEPILQERADYVYSTGGMYNHVQRSDAEIFIIGTEIGLIERMRRDFPAKKFLPAKQYIECAAMKRITLQNTYEALLNEKPVVKLPEELRIKAKRPIERMLKMSK
jgi:quinolinate synthase